MVFAVVMVGFLQVFDHSSKISKVQTAVSGAQENLRAVMTYLTRYARMAGSGGLPVVTPPVVPTPVIPLPAPGETVIPEVEQALRDQTRGR